MFTKMCNKRSKNKLLKRLRFQFNPIAVRLAFLCENPFTKIGHDTEEKNQRFQQKKFNGGGSEEQQTKKKLFAPVLLKQHDLNL